MHINVWSSSHRLPPCGGGGCGGGGVDGQQKADPVPTAVDPAAALEGIVHKLRRAACAVALPCQTRTARTCGCSADCRSLPVGPYPRAPPAPPPCCCFTLAGAGSRAGPGECIGRWVGGCAPSGPSLPTTAWLCAPRGLLPVQRQRGPAAAPSESGSWPSSVSGTFSRHRPAHSSGTGDGGLHGGWVVVQDNRGDGLALSLLSVVH